eukprot:8174953-Alexandrium_andersonii.AAC.1
MASTQHHSSALCRHPSSTAHKTIATSKTMTPPLAWGICSCSCPFPADSPPRAPPPALPRPSLLP